jgi:hypothetical protein
LGVVQLVLKTKQSGGETTAADAAPPTLATGKLDDQHGLVILFHHTKNTFAAMIPVLVDINGKKMGVLTNHEGEFEFRILLKPNRLTISLPKVWQITMPPGHVKLTAHGAKINGVTYEPISENTADSRHTEFELAANQTVIYAVHCKVPMFSRVSHPEFVVGEEEEMHHHMHRTPAILTWPPAGNE